MSWGDNVIGAVAGYGNQYSKRADIDKEHTKKTNKWNTELNKLDRESEEWKDLKNKIDEAAMEHRYALKKDTYDTINIGGQHIDEVIAQMEANFTKCTMTAQELTNYIKQSVPTYDFDCSEENLKRQKDLHDRALKALHDHAKYMFKEDPFSRMGRNVWSAVRSQMDYGTYVGMFMEDAAKEELTALSKMADEGKQGDPEFIARKNELHKKICLDVMDKAAGKMEEYFNLTTEQMIDRYAEIYTFTRMGDSTNLMPALFTPEERAKYHKAANPFLNPMAILMNRISALASDMGDKMDVEQVSQMSVRQQKLLQGSETNVPYRELPEEGDKILWDAFKDFEFASSNEATMLKNYLEQHYKQFELKYSTEEKSVYAKGYNQEHFIYQTVDGKEIDFDEAGNEMKQWHRPVYVSTKNDPSAKPVLAYLDNGRPRSGAEAEKAFLKQQSVAKEIAAEPYPPLEHKAELGFFGKLWNGLCNLLEKIPNVRANPLRTQEMRDYNQETREYEAKKAEYDERIAKYKAENEKNKELCGEELNSKEKIDAIHEELFKARPELKQKAAEIEQARGVQAQVENPVRAEKPISKGQMTDEAEKARVKLEGKFSEALKFSQEYFQTGEPAGRMAQKKPNRMDNVTAAGKTFYAKAAEIARSLRNGEMAPDTAVDASCLYNIAAYEVLHDFYQNGDKTLEDHMESGLGSRGLTMALKGVPEIKECFDNMTAEKFIKTVNDDNFMKFSNDVKKEIAASAKTVKENLIASGKAAPRREEKLKMNQPGLQASKEQLELGNN